MNWLAWRQHRTQLLVFGILLVIYAALVIPTGLHFWHTYQHELANCAQNPANPSCTDLSSTLFQTTADKILLGLIPVTVLFLPLILGVFWGAPLLSKEYDEGTNGLAWTQSVSRKKWLSVKLLWMLLATIIFVGAFAALNTWWSNTSNSLNMDRFSDGNAFGVQGIVPVTVGLFVVAWGIMFGAWFRKVMLAVGLTFAVYVAAAHIVIPNLVRPNYVKPVTITAPVGPRRLSTPAGSWVINQLIYRKNGQVVYGDIYPSMPPDCQKLAQNTPVPNGSVAVKAKFSGVDPVDDCLNRHGWYQVAKYQPSYRYWEFQEIESAIYLGMTAIAVATTYWLVLKRDA